MEELINLNEEALNEVAGGAATEKKHIEIIGCKVCCNVRSTPNSKSDSNIIGKAYLGDRYIFYAWNGNWAKIQFGDRKAYVFRDFVYLNTMTD